MVWAIVCVHGAGGGAWEFDMFWKSIFTSQNWPFLAINLIPIDPIEETSLEDYTNQIIQQTNSFINSLEKNYNDVQLVLCGASMGGVLILRIGQILQTKAIICICSTIPKNCMTINQYGHEIDVPIYSSSKEYPPRIHWTGLPLQDTIDSLPDATLEVCQIAASQWRDESGQVMNTIVKGLECPIDYYASNCYNAVVIPLQDLNITPSSQLRLGQALKATIFQYENMSHVGPLLGKNASKVALDILNWLNSL